MCLRERVRAARIARGLYEDDMAIQYDIPVETYRKWEDGDAELPQSVIESICTDLGLPTTVAADADEWPPRGDDD
jgi:transcriptional regulator with XRE-family HTH domain